MYYQEGYLLGKVYKDWGKICASIHYVTLKNKPTPKGRCLVIH